MKTAQINIFLILRMILGVWPKNCPPQVKNGQYLSNGSTIFAQKISGSCSHRFLSIPMGIGCDKWLIKFVVFDCPEL
jgi:hypothetical protein